MYTVLDNLPQKKRQGERQAHTQPSTRRQPPHNKTKKNRPPVDNLHKDRAPHEARTGLVPSIVHERPIIENVVTHNHLSSQHRRRTKQDQMESRGLNSASDLANLA